MKISFLIPAYNEEANISGMLEDVLRVIKREQWDAEIIVVDDNSTDRTGEIIKQYQQVHTRIRAFHKTTNPGMGHTLIFGTNQAMGDIIIWTMADRSDDVNTYAKLVEKIQEGYDMVFASRYAAGGSRGDLSRFKALLSSGFTSFTRIFFGMPVHDITNAFRAFRKEVFDAIALERGDFSISPEFAIKAYKMKFRLAEVPTIYANRKMGKSNFKYMRMGIQYISLFKYRMLGTSKRTSIETD